VTSVPPSAAYAGRRLHAFARRWLDRETLERVVEPGIADLQWLVERTDRGWRGQVVRARAWLGCAAVCIVGVCLQRRRYTMRPQVRTTLTGVGFVAVFSLVIASLALPVPHAAIAVLAAACMAPVVLTALAVAARWGIAAATRNALTIVPAGFLVGAALGWAAVPAAWTASLWVTIDASMNAKTYGAAFEHTAERALMYPFFFGILGALAAGVLAVVATWRMARHRRSVALAG
jgi:hypothetical protein